MRNRSKADREQNARLLDAALLELRKHAHAALPILRSRFREAAELPESGEERFYLVRAIALLQSEEALPTLRDLTTFHLPKDAPPKDPRELGPNRVADAQIRHIAVQGLADLVSLKKSDEALRELQNLAVNSPDSYTRWQAKKYLTGMSGQTAN